MGADDKVGNEGWRGSREVGGMDVVEEVGAGGGALRRFLLDVMLLLLLLLLLLKRLLILKELLLRILPTFLRVILLFSLDNKLD